MKEKENWREIFRFAEKTEKRERLEERKWNGKNRNGMRGDVAQVDFIHMRMEMEMYIRGGQIYHTEQKTHSHSRRR